RGGRRLQPRSGDGRVRALEGRSSRAARGGHADGRLPLPCPAAGGSTMNRRRRHLVRERMTRRDLLLGASGLAVALPLLPSLTARAQDVAAPKRLVLMYTPNGVVPDAWKPTNVTSET